MKLHFNHCSAPYNMYSCASRVISMVTGEDDVDITLRVMQRRIQQGLSRAKAHRQTQMMWDCEVRFELRQWLRKTRCIYPQRKLTLLQLSRRLQRHEYALVMLPEHIVIINDQRLYDVHYTGASIRHCNMWKDAPVYWYQRMHK